MVYSIELEDDKRLIPSYVVLIPGFFSLVVVFLLARWPDNPCQSLTHLLVNSFSILKYLTLVFILLKIDKVLYWEWTTIFWYLKNIVKH